MNTLNKYSLKLEEKDYHNYPAWSYSIIAKYAKTGFDALKSLHDKTEPTASMRFGSLFDSMITKGKKTLEQYAVYDGDIPQSEKNVLDYIVSTSTVKTFEDIPSETIVDACNACGYYTRWGYEARYKRLSAYADYYSIATSGKEIVSKEDWNDAKDMMSIFRNNAYLSKLFGTKNTKDTEYIYQSQFVIDYALPSGRTVKIKIMPDLLVINHKEKKIQPVDLKTSSTPAWNFRENFINFRYDIQAKLYSDVLQEVISKDDELSKYKVQPYLFTDISRVDKVPVTYVYDQTDLLQKNGLSFYNGSGKTYTYKSWQCLLDEILSYEETNAKVPSYIKTDTPNDIISLIEKRYDNE